MPLINVNWEVGKTSEIKQKLRERLKVSVAELVCVKEEMVAVQFQELSTDCYHGLGTIVTVTWTQGRSDEMKDKLAECVTNAVCAVTGFSSKAVHIFIIDIPRGNIGTDGKITNREGPPTISNM